MSKTYTEAPDQWCVIKITTDDKVNYKVFGSWIGGYTGGDAWKMNSGVESIEGEDDYYYFHGFSGSCYRCHKNTYGAGTSYTRSMNDCYDMFKLLMQGPKKIKFPALNYHA